MDEKCQSKDLRIAIIGAGISGLFAAHALKCLGYNHITVFEANETVGGRIHTKEINGGAIFSAVQHRTGRIFGRLCTVAGIVDRLAAFWDRWDNLEQCGKSQQMSCKCPGQSGRSLYTDRSVGAWKSEFVLDAATACNSGSVVDVL